ncbi:MAG: imidazole glycerol phosphate synthase subunit HisF [Phycisphaerales bacterium]|nr:imidazole glycerol phosphate synthase subunit HisF [Phycisphaerales bacterium]
MLTRRIIPCLDVTDGRVVKGIRFAGLRDMGDPAALAAEYASQGADEIIILDISATTSLRATAADVVSRCRAALSIPLTVGGGVRSIDDASRLLDRGADRVCVNSAAVERPGLITELADRYGTQCVVVAADARRSSAFCWTILTRSGQLDTGLDAVRWARKAGELGAGEMLLTSWDRDGTRDGYDLELLRAVCGATRIPVVASGGAATVRHMKDAFDAGADAVLAASIFHEGVKSVGAIKQALSGFGVEVRL